MIVKAERIFLAEGHVEPVSSNALASGVPEGVLLLTNRRLLFLHEPPENEPPTTREESFQRSMAKDVAKGAATGAVKGILAGLTLGASDVAFGAADVASGISDIRKALPQKITELELRQLREGELSFVYPVESIVSYRQEGSVLGIRPKNSFLRLTIRDEKKGQIPYCMYANVPGKPFTKIMNHGKWVDALRKVANVPEESRLVGPLSAPALPHVATGSPPRQGHAVVPSPSPGAPPSHLDSALSAVDG